MDRLERSSLSKRLLKRCSLRRQGWRPKLLLRLRALGPRFRLAFSTSEPPAPQYLRRLRTIQRRGSPVGIRAPVLQEVQLGCHGQQPFDHWLFASRSRLERPVRLRHQSVELYLVNQISGPTPYG